MTAGRTVLEMARADFLERARRPNFLLTLAAAAGLAWTVHADVWTVLVGGSAPAPGPAATGTLMAVITSIFLSLAAFYLVRGAVDRDLRTGVGPILAATPANRLQYATGKFLSNTAVLGAMLLLLAGLAVAIEADRAGGISLAGAWGVVSPSLLITAPALAAVAGAAVLFDALPWLRGTPGNAAYFFLWAGVLTFAGFDTGSAWTDVTGVNLVFEALEGALRAARPGAAAEGLTVTTNALAGEDVARFAWSGIGWSAAHAARRLWWVGVGAGLSALGAASLRLFDPFGDRTGLFPSSLRPGDPRDDTAPAGDDEAVAGPGGDAGAGAVPRAARQHAIDSGPGSPSDLPPAAAGGPLRSFLRTTGGELRLLLSGHRWWWYLGLAGANAAALLVPVEDAPIPLLVAWLLPLSAWSQLGCRERLHGTEALLFSGPSPRLRQLPAQLAAGIALSVLAAAVPLGRLAAEGRGAALTAAAVGAFFVPALALCLGAWTGKEKTFQAIYLVLWYLGPVNEIPALDFMGVTGRAVEAGATAAFGAAAAVLATLAWVARGRRIRGAAVLGAGLLFLTACGGPAPDAGSVPTGAWSGDIDFAGGADRSWGVTWRVARGDSTGGLTLSMSLPTARDVGPVRLYARGDTLRFPLPHRRPVRCEAVRREDGTWRGRCPAPGGGPSAEVLLAPPDRKPPVGLARMALERVEGDWRASSGGPVVVHTRPGTEAHRHRDAVLRHGRAAVEHAVALLGAEGWEGPLRLVYLESPEEMERAFGRPVRGGSADAGGNGVLLVTYQGGATGVVHEVLHVVSMRQWGAAASPGMWLQEGLAEWGEGAACGDVPHGRLHLYLERRGDGLPVDTLAAGFRRHSDTITMPQATTLVAYLVDAHGLEAVRALWERGIGEAEAVLGYGAEELGRRWRAWVEDRFEPATPEQWERTIGSEYGCPRETPGPVEGPAAR